MPFWSDVASQPKLSFKYLASFGIGGDIIRTYTVRSFQRPSFSIATSEYVWLNDVNFKPGVLSWNPIEITLTDGEDVQENNAKNLVEALNKSGDQTDTVSQPRSTIEKGKSSIALGGQVVLTQINSESLPVDEWILINPFLESVNFGQNNYGAEEIITLSITIRYDYAQYNFFSN